jgi:prepilin-type N-terminal cleavage/methylation domain-containing protein
MPALVRPNGPTVRCGRAGIVGPLDRLRAHRQPGPQGVALGWANAGPSAQCPCEQTRSAFTLIEMLIVVTIMMILVAAAATVFRPAGESRRIREAAREIYVYLGSARNRAMETGRPCGVIFRRFAGAPAAAMTADQCEVPPCYCGDTEQSYAQVTYLGTGNVISATLDAAPPTSLVSPGDLIQFNCQGPLYPILTVGATLTATVDVTQGQMVPWPTNIAQATRVPYRIFRAPMKGGATPLQLPASAVVDLEWSGTDTVLFGATAGDVTIMFAPNGSVDRVYSSVTLLNGPVTQPIFLLIGKRERIPPPASPVASNPDTFANWQDLNNLWVVVNPQTGLVTTGEVKPVVPWSTTFNSGCRDLARDAQSMGGK